MPAELEEQIDGLRDAIHQLEDRLGKDDPLLRLLRHKLDGMLREEYRQHLRLITEMMTL